MAIITSRAVGVDTTANQPAAATANRLYVHTTSGSKLYLPEIDDGAAWQPWRANVPYLMFSVHTTAATWNVDPGGIGTYLSFDTTNQANLHNLDFTRFRQGRIIARCSNSALSSGSILVKIVDITNTQDLTPAVTFLANGLWATRVSAWQALNSATYAGDAIFEIQGLSGMGDALAVGTISLELR